MAKFTGHTITPDSALGGIQIEKSLRFEEDDTTYLEASPTFNTKKYTFSFWIKPVKKGGGAILSYNMVGNNRQSFSYGDYEGHFANQLRVGGSTKSQYATTAAHRDFSSWYHVVYRWDTDNGTQDDRFIVYVNGVRRAMTQYTGTVSGQTGYIGDGNTINIGKSTDGYSKARFYLADFHLIDGQAYDATYFGYTDAQTGQWRPKEYTGSYGSGGFHLEFKDTSNLGKDTSGNANNWTANNFSVAAGENNDSLLDTPTNNFATFSSLVKSANTITQGGLKVTCSSSTDASFHSTLGVSSGKYYMEFLVKSTSNYVIGVSGTQVNSDYYSAGNQVGFWLGSSFTRVFKNGSNITSNSVVVGNFESGVEGSNTAWSVDDIAGLALDMDKKIIYLYKGSTQVGYVDLSGYSYEKVFFGGGNYISGQVYVGNFGQRPFAHTPPTGYRSLCSKNLATPSPASVVNPRRHFGTLIYSGNGAVSGREVTGLEFQPDFVWIKNRTQGYDHHLYDSVRGVGKWLESNDTTAEQTGTHMDGFLPNGISVGNGVNSQRTNAADGTYVAWCWKAGGTAVTNTVGNISAQVSANQEAGFSIITYTGDGNTSGNVGTGLRSTEPLAFAIVKRRDSTSDWHVGHHGANQGVNFAYHLNLNDTSILSGNSPYHMASQSATNGDRLYLAEGGLTSSATYVAYVWQERPGFSKFGHYSGTSDSDGVYVDCGFRPAFIIFKKFSTSTDSWEMHDSVRNTTNPVGNSLNPDTNSTEGSNRNVDFLAQGFKHRNANGNTNEGGCGYVFMAWAEQPSGTMFGLDANAR